MSIKTICHEVAAGRPTLYLEKIDLQALTNDQARAWCEREGFRVSTNRYISYSSNTHHGLTLNLDTKPSRIIALANYLVPDWGGEFKGALLWFTDWGIWNDHHEETGMKIVDQLRTPTKGSLIDMPAQLFGPNERNLMQAFFVVPLLFSWDAFLIPEGEDYFVFVSHDEIAGIIARDEIACDRRFSELESWKPEKNDSWYFKHLEHRQ
jgi:hypothetical protein